MDKDSVKRQTNFKTALMLGLSLLPETPPRKEIEQKAKQLADLFEYDEPIENPVERQERFTATLIAGLSAMPKPPTIEEVEEKAGQLADVFGYDAPLEPAILGAFKNMYLRMGVGVLLLDSEGNTGDEK